MHVSSCFVIVIKNGSLLLCVFLQNEKMNIFTNLVNGYFLLSHYVIRLLHGWGWPFCHHQSACCQGVLVFNNQLVVRVCLCLTQ